MASIHTTIIDLVTVFRACDGIVVSRCGIEVDLQEPIFFIIVIHLLHRFYRWERCWQMP
jgi:hypothetical protein